MGLYGERIEVLENKLAEYENTVLNANEEVADDEWEGGSHLLVTNANKPKSPAICCDVRAV